MINGQNPNLPIRYGNSFKSNAVLTANTPETVITPATNARGCIVWVATFTSEAAANGGSTALLAKTSAPTTSIDGDALCTPNQIAVNGNRVIAGQTYRPVFVAAGKGLYFVALTNEVSGYRSVLYDLL